MTLQPEGENLRKAVRWVSLERQATPPRPMAEILDEAARRYDLSPLQQEVLFRELTRKPPEAPGSP